jgi:hypothetical protein
MRKILWRSLPSVIHAVDVGDWDIRQLLFAYTLQTADVYTIHLSDRSFVSDSKRPDATDLAEEVLILSCIEEVLSEHSLS